MSGSDSGAGAAASADFTAALAEEYRMLAAREADKPADESDAPFLAARAREAGTGEIVQPLRVRERPLPLPELRELARARDRLVAQLDGSARSRRPALAARAQSRFDCWAIRVENARAPQAIMACRRAALKALDQLEGDPALASGRERVGSRGALSGRSAPEAAAAIGGLAPAWPALRPSPGAVPNTLWMPGSEGT